MNYHAIFFATIFIVASPVVCYMVQPDGYDYHKVAIVAGFVWPLAMVGYSLWSDVKGSQMVVSLMTLLCLAAMSAMFVLPIVALIHGLV